ncbi:hypothetical protein CYMTET_31760 [Cymbomonas tetramitiformis]|uniref:Uncharacterized protein n=1 Tax=Cymbomonas tetramitiformis TaxID=36881 RepID=A0AAE0FGT6_9CHLO|nr:hypothetical protein CYMTET_31760 [Cymbomonas tetramitiformis]
MPRMYCMYSDKTYDSLTKKSALSMKCEYTVLAPALALLHDALMFRTVEGLEAEEFTPNDVLDINLAILNSMHDVYSLLRNRFTVLQLLVSIDAEGAFKSDTDGVHAKLKIVENCVHQGTEDLVNGKDDKERRASEDKGKGEGRGKGAGADAHYNVRGTALPGANAFGRQAEAPH